MPDRHFERGWRDRLAGLPERAGYEKMRTLPRVQYERGRHVAAMWQFWLSVRVETRPQDDADIWQGKFVPYTRALRMMPAALRNAIALEAHFCSLQGELLSRV